MSSEQVIADIDVMRDVYMSRAQREAYERILARNAEQAAKFDAHEAAYRLQFDACVSMKAKLTALLDGIEEVERLARDSAEWVIAGKLKRLRESSVPALWEKANG